MARFTPSTITAPRAGVEFHAMRVLALGLSARDVAARLQVSPLTLQGWERSWQPVAEARAGAWRKALADAAVARRDRLAREGLPAGHMAGTDFERAIAALRATAASATA
jgi:hypothetical protein